MSNITPVSGSTVRLSSKFTDFKGDVVTPQLVRLVIYNYKYVVLEEHTVSTKNDQNEYIHNFITNAKPMTYIVEWYGEIDGYPSIHRESFITRQMSV